MNHANNKFRLLLTAMLLSACSAILLPIVVSAQSQVSPTAGITPEILGNRVRETEATVDLDEKIKSRLLEYYRKASSLIVQRRSHEAAAGIQYGFIRRYCKILPSTPTRTQVTRPADLAPMIPVIESVSLKQAE